MADENSPLDLFKKKVGSYMVSHGAAAEYYRQSVSGTLSKHVGDGDKPKTLGEVLKSEGPLESALKSTFENLMKKQGVSSDYVKGVLLQDLAVTIQELREEFAGQLDQTYDAETVARVMGLAEQKLGRKLVDATFAELGKLEKTGHYKGALEHVLDTAKIRDQYNSLPSDGLPHAQVTRAIYSDFYRNVLPKSRADYRNTSKKAA
jgi:hypothetical protein